MGRFSFLLVPVLPFTMTTNGVNGHASHSRPLNAGMFAPIPTFFLPESEDLGSLPRTSTPVL